MVVEEMKYIQELLCQIMDEDNERKFSEAEDEEVNSVCRNNLFSLIAINEVIMNYHKENMANIDFRTFLKKGVLSADYDEIIPTPTITFVKGEGNALFYNFLVDALTNNEYYLDEIGNIIISNDNMVAEIPQVWLYRLGKVLSNQGLERVYFYDKNRTRHIASKDELLEFLRTSKTFLVQMNGSSNEELTKIFFKIEQQLEEEFKGQKQVKVSEIMARFKELLPPNISVSLNKFKLSEDFNLLRKAQRLSDIFYSEPLNMQKEFLNKWVVDRISNKDKSNAETQKFIVLRDVHDNLYSADSLNKELITIGLFRLYINLLMQTNIDLSSISLTDFRLKAYMSEEAQQTKIKLHNLKANERVRAEEIAKIESETSEILEKINALDVLRDFEEIGQKRERYVSLLDLLEMLRNEDKNAHGEMVNSNVEEIAFDNEKIMSLIHRALNHGHIYFDKNDLVIEDYNKELAEPTFKVVINKDKLLEFIRIFNLTLGDYGTIGK